MNELLARILTVGILSSGAPTPAPAPPGDGGDLGACVSRRLGEIVDTARLLDEDAAVIARSVGDALPAVARQVEKLRATAQKVQGDASQALSEQVSVEATEQALNAGSLGLSLLRSKVARLKLALIDSSDATTKHAVAEMVLRLEEAQQLIPPDEPARGCR